MKYTLICLLIATSMLSCDKNDDIIPGPDPAAIESRVITSNLNFPWEILWGPDSTLWITERLGTVSRVNPVTGAVTPLITIPDVTSYTDFNGLLGMVLHPQFNTNPEVFVVYNYGPRTNYKEKVVRYTYNGTTLTNPMIIVDNLKGIDSGSAIHNGSRLLITPDLKLFITTGDAQDTTLPQNMSSLNGKTLRVNLDGTIPADNPFPGSPVWTLGHRNVQGIVMVGSTLYISEHGPNSDDEINVLEKGRNYGWPFVRGICNLPDEITFCTANNVVQPIISWTPTIAPCGIDYYTSDYIPQWKNSFLMTTLKDMRLKQLKVSGTAMTEISDFFVNQYGRIRDLAISPQGKVYICTDNGNNGDVIVEIDKD
ncbi:MAG TPA: PQQ-dependent sugar dehydrogenase [Ferruginibacter sp.]|nr:PQQ-dependent sugar dehydrogenase [Ferruginibacter sp.]